MEGNVIQPNGASGGGITYSTTETLTGDTWIDGSPIYRKAGSYTLNNTQGLTPYNDFISSGVRQPIRIFGICKYIYNGKSYATTIPTNGLDFISPQIDNPTVGNVTIYTKHSNDLFNGATVELVLEYTKL